MQKLLSVVAIFMLATTAIARVDLECKVDGLQRDVEFITGSELNRATSSYRYTSYKVYALLWYSQTQVSILEHQGYALGISSTFSTRDLESLYRVWSSQDFRPVNGSSSRTVTIVCKQYGVWVDRRLR